MTAVVLVAQVALPIALLIWLAFTPFRSILVVAFLALGTGALLFALARVAQWALPVWWLPFVYGGLWLAAVVARPLLRGRGGLSVLPRNSWGWSCLALSILMLGAGAWYGARAVAARNPPPAEVADIANPFGPGHYLVAHGGSNTLVNGHMKTLDERVERYRAWRGQSYAVDFFGIGPLGLRARGWQPTDPTAYAIFGAELRAPCDGLVVAAEGGMPDFEVPNHDAVNRLGNHVILRCGSAEIVLAHMRQGSLAVAAGDRATTGDPLGEVGNSGASTEPHLHIHAQRPATEGRPPISSEPLGLRIDGRILVRGDRLKGPDA